MPLGSHSQPALGAGRHWPLGSIPQPSLGVAKHRPSGSIPQPILVSQSEEKSAQSGSKKEGAVDTSEAARATAMKLRRMGEVSARHRPRTSLARGDRVPQS